MKNRVIAFLLIALVAAVSLTPVAAQAQGLDELTLSVSPPLFELTANPGDTIKNKIRLSNLSDQPQDITVSIKNFTAQGEEGGVELTEETTNFSLASWVTVDEESITIPAKKDHVFNFTVDVPTAAEPGGHFGSIIFRAETDPIKDGSGAAVSPEIGALLLVKVAGDIEEKGSIVEFFAKPSFYEKGPFYLVTRFKNQGNVHFKPRGTITFSNIFGQEVGNIEFDERNVLPDSIRRIENEWNPSGFRIGRYTATASLVYGADDKIANATTTFWVIPWKQLLVLLAVLVVIVFIGVRYRDRFKEAYRALSGKK